MANYILRKVDGNGHGGGEQLAPGSANYNNLESFLNCYPAVVPIEEAYLPLVVGFEYKYVIKDSIPLIRLITNC